MDEVQQYERYLRERITTLRSQKGVSEHRLSLELGKSGFLYPLHHQRGHDALHERAVQHHGVF